MKFRLKISIDSGLKQHNIDSCYPDIWEFSEIYGRNNSESNPSSLTNIIFLHVCNINYSISTWCRYCILIKYKKNLIPSGYIVSTYFKIFSTSSSLNPGVTSSSLTISLKIPTLNSSKPNELIYCDPKVPSAPFKDKHPPIIAQQLMAGKKSHRHLSPGKGWCIT